MCVLTSKISEKILLNKHVPDFYVVYEIKLFPLCVHCVILQKRDAESTKHCYVPVMRNLLFNSSRILLLEILL